MIGAPWELEDEFLLKRYIGEGLTSQEIGWRMGRSRNSIIGKANRMKIRDPDAIVRRGGRPRRPLAKPIAIKYATPPARIHNWAPMVEFIDPNPKPTGFATPRHREAYYELQQAVLNTK